jgi:hypothetical protein
LIVMQSMRLVLVGGIAGIAGAWFLDRFLAVTPVGVNAHDPVSLTLAWVCLVKKSVRCTGLPASCASILAFP